MSTLLVHRSVRLTDEQRSQLIEHLAISERTWYRWMERPGDLIPGDALRIIQCFYADLVPAEHYTLDQLLADAPMP